MYQRIKEVEKGNTVNENKKIIPVITILEQGDSLFYINGIMLVKNLILERELEALKAFLGVLQALDNIYVELLRRRDRYETSDEKLQEAMGSQIDYYYKNIWMPKMKDTMEIREKVIAIGEKLIQLNK